MKFTFEIFPPRECSTENLQALRGEVSRLSAANPEFVSVTYGAGGSGQERSLKVVRDLAESAGVPIAAHLTTIGLTYSAAEKIVDEWKAQGVRTIVALRGDIPSSGDPLSGDFQRTSELVRFIKERGDFRVFVAGYPERHPDSPSWEVEIDFLKGKIDAGADGVITQYFFEPSHFLRYRDRLARAGIQTDLIPGILPVSNIRQVVSFSEKCGASVPDWLVERFSSIQDDKELLPLVSASTCSDLCRTLSIEGVSSFHFYTLNRATLPLAVARVLLHGERRKEAA